MSDQTSNITRLKPQPHHAPNPANRFFDAGDGTVISLHRGADEKLYAIARDKDGNCHPVEVTPQMRTAWALVDYPQPPDDAAPEPPPRSLGAAAGPSAAETPTQFRLSCLAAGYAVTPTRGKAPVLDGWQNKHNLTASDIEGWTRTSACNGATNTGLVTRGFPCLDIDIRHPAAASAVEQAVRDFISRDLPRYELPTRYGELPKRALIFRTDAPFPKLTINFLPRPGEKSERLEFLGDGQQLVINGIHPDTRAPYTWRNGAIPDIVAAELVTIDASVARRIINLATEVLTEQFGYIVRAAGKSRAETDANRVGDGLDDPPGFDWGQIDHILDHDILTRYAMAMAASGWHASPGTLFNFLLNRLEAIRPQAEAHGEGERWQRRRSELHDIVDSAAAKAEAKAEAKDQQGADGQTGPQGAYDPAAKDGTAFNYSWRFRAPDDQDATATRELVQGILPETGAGLISGQWGLYKSFVAINLTVSVMRGTKFAGRKVMRQGAVMWVVAEGQSGIRKRFAAAWKEAAGGDFLDAPLLWVERSPRLLDKHGGKILAAMAQHAQAILQAKFGLPLALVVIDTLGKAAKAAKTGDMNDDVTAKISMGALTEASQATGALFLGLAHFGKDENVGTKGSSGFEDDSDVVLALTGHRTTTGVVTGVTMAIRKNREGESGIEFTFRVRKVDIGDAEFPENTLVIDWDDPPDPNADPDDPNRERPREDRDPWSHKGPKFLREAIKAVPLTQRRKVRLWPDKPTVDAWPLAAVKAEFLKIYPANNADERKQYQAKHMAFGRAITDTVPKLVTTRDIGGTNYLWLTETAPAGDGPPDPRLEP
jgi:hypothetical protein